MSQLEAHFKAMQATKDMSITPRATLAFEMLSQMGALMMEQP